MKPGPAAFGLAVAVAVLAGAYLAGWRGWLWAVGAGAFLGAGLWFWISQVVSLAFAADTTRSPQRLLLWHGMLRLGAAAALLLLLLKLPDVPLWGVLVGYTLFQATAWWWTRRGPRSELS